ncbi:MAG: acyl-[acyl-carrier-protein]--UDP-N-acetylglucosamine O-acyltransferase [Planctomycetes bacterium]|nr:acyl-[acyl-carrier-protein]--UDP-N-acetylglucosamine O-acyltransferase [Planctomycetota bacterium]
MTTSIHSTAVVDPGAQIGAGVSIGPYTVIGADVSIGDRSQIGPPGVIDGVTTIGADNIIVGQANLGGPPQDLSYRGEATRLILGDRNTVREFVTINRGTIKGGGVTRVGDDCLFMACSHVAHDCELRDSIILGNNVMLAGHVLVEENANIAGAAGAMQFVTIGAYAYVGGMSRLAQDAPPYMIVAGDPGRVRGVNHIGLARGGCEDPVIDELRAAFRKIYRSGMPRSRVLEEMRAESGGSGELQHLLKTLERIELGQKGRYRESLRADFARQGAEEILEGGAAK